MGSKPDSVLLPFRVGDIPNPTVRNKYICGAHLGVSRLGPYRFMPESLTARSQPRNWVSDTHHATRTGKDLGYLFSLPLLKRSQL